MISIAQDGAPPAKCLILLGFLGGLFRPPHGLSKRPAVETNVQAATDYDGIGDNAIDEVCDQKYSFDVLYSKI